MLGVRPCPYCGGEVEVVRLNRKKETDNPVYRISCNLCHALVAKGLKFDKETNSEGQERIKQYEAEIERKFSRESSSIWKQSLAAKERDRIARYSSRLDPENEIEY